jgi:chemotaxis signal transduction protein
VRDAPTSSFSDRLVVFEVGGTLYALPIADVSEVTEVGRIASVPSLRASVGGVMNHHGDALPIVHRGALFEADRGALSEPRNVLVLARGPDDARRLGLPVDSVVGLVDGAGGTASGPDAVVERRPIGGRLVNVLDPQRLLMRAVQVIEESVVGADAMQGGQT